MKTPETFKNVDSYLLRAFENIVSSGGKLKLTRDVNSVIVEGSYLNNDAVIRLNGANTRIDSILAGYKPYVTLDVIFNGNRIIGNHDIKDENNNFKFIAWQLKSIEDLIRQEDTTVKDYDDFFNY